ncbi:MAG: protein-methionine-sulfoxide reductase catalytic subunit MsrP [Gammaproteobacteria bacterium]|nr:protein-methionine-sulfoxide reductase catalytic subunit MsrP [Gammaproteobacteria bacterium]
MLIRTSKTRVADAIGENEVTPQSVYLSRRRFTQDLAAGLAFASGLGITAANAATPLKDVIKSEFGVDEKITEKKSAITYNNFYEFGTGKSDPSKNSGDFKPRPWTVKVAGECAKPGDYDLDDFLKPAALEERIYRLRCVEAWSMVIPWIGVPLGAVLSRFEPNSNAKYVAFETIFRPEEMPGQRRPTLKWPYVEGLRIDEAMNPLSLLAVGMYGETLPNQNGAPLRLVVPWKYGFKSIKSIVSIRFMDKEPPTTWNLSAPREYGFYSNVNPEVDHPRWSQRKERRIGEWKKRKTLMFNGYADQVASLYSGMDMAKHF